MTPILAVPDESLREHLHARLLEAGCEEVHVVESLTALDDCVAKGQVVVTAGNWPAPRQLLREAVRAGTHAIALLDPATSAAERAALAEGARAVLDAETPATSLAATLTAVQCGLIVLDRPLARHSAPRPLASRPRTLDPDDEAQELADRPARRLTSREREILSLVASGTSNKGVARVLGVSTNTVKFHLAATFEKLDVATRAEAVAEAIRRGELSL